VFPRGTATLLDPKDSENRRIYLYLCSGFPPFGIPGGCRNTSFAIEHDGKWKMQEFSVGKSGHTMVWIYKEVGPAVRRLPGLNTNRIVTVFQKDIEGQTDLPNRHNDETPSSR